MTASKQFFAAALVLLAAGAPRQADAAAGGGPNPKGASRTGDGQWVVTDETILATDPRDPGQSISGLGVFVPGLDIREANGNLVAPVSQGNLPPAYGAPSPGDLVNGCAPPSTFADLGAAASSYAPSSRTHRYVFTVEEGKTLSKISIGILDWGDYLPNGACADGKCAMVLTAYGPAETAVGTVSGRKVKTPVEHALASSEVSFESPGANKYRNPESDACSAGTGNAVLTVEATGITKVVLAPAERGSLDPNMAVYLVDVK